MSEPHSCSRASDIDVVVASPGEMDTVRGLWREYWNSFGLSEDFQSFGEEWKTLPGPYAPPAGRLLLAFVHGEAAGTAGLRPLRKQACEAKRLYVRPEYRGKGVGRALLERLVSEARAAGYEEMYGDTLQSMRSALEMYYRMGFCEVGPYSEHPTPGAIFLRLSLSEMR